MRTRTASPEVPCCEHPNMFKPTLFCFTQPIRRPQPIGECECQTKPLLRWGKSSEYVLGALVLGHSIKRSGSKHALVCLYADDVPPSCVLLLSRIWDCRPVQHIAVAADKLGNSSPGHRFAKVFTKLRSLELVEFEKILVLDIDIYVRLRCTWVPIDKQSRPESSKSLMHVHKARQCR